MGFLVWFPFLANLVSQRSNRKKIFFFLCKSSEIERNIALSLSIIKFSRPNIVEFMKIHLLKEPQNAKLTMKLKKKRPWS